MTSIDLPEPQISLEPRLMSTIKNRESMRSFGESPLILPELANLLWAGQGTTHATTGKRLRTAPSSGAHHPYTLYVNAHASACLELDTGVYSYSPARHRLSLHHEGPTTTVEDVCQGQQAILKSKLVILLAADFADTRDEFPDLGDQFVYTEGGHIAQNILLTATAMDLAACPIGLFPTEEMNKAFALPDRHDAVYLVALGSMPV